MQEQHQGLVRPEQGSGRGNRQRLGIGQLGVVLEFDREPRIDGVELLVEAGDCHAGLLGFRLIGKSRRGIEPTHLTLTVDDELLALAHQIRERPITLGEAH